VGYLRSAAIDPECDRDYAFDLPAVTGIDDIEFGQATVLVGDNGTGKSTLVKALAVAAGFNAEGGSKNLRFTTYATHSLLSRGLVLTWDRMPKWGWFIANGETLAPTIEPDMG
jgi:predicted ATPase